jgi:hypothetical protein
MISPAARARAKPATTHWMEADPVCSVRCMDGMATFTMKKSSVVMNEPATMTNRLALRRLASGGRRAVSGAAAELCVLMLVIPPVKRSDVSQNRPRRSCCRLPLR